MHAVPCRWLLSITSVILVVAGWLCASAASVTFLVTSDSHYDALENEDRNRGDRVRMIREPAGGERRAWGGTWGWRHLHSREFKKQRHHIRSAYYD